LGNQLGIGGKRRVEKGKKPLSLGDGRAEKRGNYRIVVSALVPVRIFGGSPLGAVNTWAATVGAPVGRRVDEGTSQPSASGRYRLSKTMRVQTKVVRNYARPPGR
jgi:hypothetical protein